MAALDLVEIVTVQEIMEIASLSEVTLKAAVQTDEQNTRTRADIVQWEKYSNKFSELEGGKFGLKKDPEKALLRIANRVRNRFGYLPLSSLNSLQTGLGSYSVSTPVSDDYDCGCP